MLTNVLVLKRQDMKIKCILKKALYGIKQAPRAWNKRTNCFRLQLGFSKCTTKYGIYVRATI